jgi:hypothetical protein
MALQKPSVNIVLSVATIALLILASNMLVNAPSEGQVSTPRSQVGQLQLNQQPPPAAAGSNSTPYMVTLLETMANEWNSTAPESQPKFFVAGPTGLESSANISLPARRLIELVIISYDTPTPPPAQYSTVTGTVGGKMYLINGTSASMGTPESWGAGVSSVPTNQIAHTFTIVSLGINIPIVGGDTEIAFLYLNQTGTFTWQCYTPCGFPNVNGGWSGAMVTPGWMTGEVTVYQTPTTTMTSATATAATSGISFDTMAIVSFGMILVGFVVGLIVLSRFAFPKKKAGTE